MTEDHSLDEFVGDQTTDAGDESDAPSEGCTDTPDEERGVDTDDLVDPSTAAPATATSAWTADGDDCERCGVTATRRWNDDGDLVCPACKEW
ncbi:MAG: hypothetical protein PPP55_06215 [Halorubrum sp.]